MKKLIILLVFLLAIQTSVYADVTGVSYTYDEEFIQILDAGLEYKGYSGVLNFSVTEKDPDEVGIKVSLDKMYYVPFEIPFVGDLSSGNFSMRIGGRGLEYGNYIITPYFIKNGVKTYGEPVSFNISENCVAMTNLRIAYEQINLLSEKGIFNENEQKIVDYIIDVAARVIADGENGTEITKEYVRANYGKECVEVKAMYDSLGKSTDRIKFAGKFNPPNLDKTARVYLMTEFELMKFI